MGDAGSMIQKETVKFTNEHEEDIKKYKKRLSEAKVKVGDSIKNALAEKSEGTDANNNDEKKDDKRENEVVENKYESEEDQSKTSATLHKQENNGKNENVSKEEQRSTVVSLVDAVYPETVERLGLKLDEKEKSSSSTNEEPKETDADVDSKPNYLKVTKKDQEHVDSLE